MTRARTLADLGSQSLATDAELAAEVATLDSSIDTKFDTTNILGTVSESSGVPTGAIIEQGSNGNGHYTKYADGTLICRNNTTVTSSSGQPITFPVAFSAAPSVTAIAEFTGTGSIVIHYDTLTTTGVTFYRTNVGGSRINGPFSYIAIGRWY